jgi:hypothetical protein
MHGTHGGSTRVVFLCHRPTPAQLEFYGTFPAAGFDVSVVVDDDAWRIDPPAGVTAVYVPEDECVAAGYTDFNPAVVKPSHCSAWDKALYHFSRQHFSRQHFSRQHFSRQHLTQQPAGDDIWLIEDDVFLDSAGTLRAIDERYRGIDIVSAENVLHHDPRDPQWPWIRFVPADVLPGPWTHSMVCAVRLSDPVLGLVAEFIRTHGATLARGNGWKRRLHRLAAGLRIPQGFVESIAMPHYPFIEYIFHTLAVHEGLSVHVADELATIKWQQQWRPEELEAGRLYHPVKAIDRHPEFRRRIEVGGDAV